MNWRLLRFAIIAAGIGSLASAPADATTVSIGLAQDGGAISTAASGTDSAAFSGSFGAFSTNIVTGTSDVGSPEVLSTTSTNTNNSGAQHTLDVYVAVQDYTEPTGLQRFLSQFTSNALIGGGLTVTESTYLDTSNGGGGIFNLASMTLLGSGAFPPLLGLASATSASLLVSAPYELLAVYHIVAGAHLTSTGTITVSVPGPIVGAGLPGLILACAGLVSLARRRRKRAAV